MSFSIALIVCFIGGFVYLIAGIPTTDPARPRFFTNFVELCRLAFFAGLLALLLTVK